MYVVTIKDKQYNSIAFKFSDFDLMVEFVAIALKAGDVDINIALENPNKAAEPEPQAEQDEAND